MCSISPLERFVFGMWIIDVDQGEADRTNLLVAHGS